MRVNHSISQVVATFFYSGYFPFAPGTFASLLAVLVWFFLPWSSVLFKILSMLIILILGFASVEVTEKSFKEADPSFIVIDEVIGMWITVITLPKSVIVALLAFLMFRIFDIVKPPPIRRLELLKGSLGIIIDDVVAGIYAAISVHILLWIF